VLEAVQKRLDKNPQAMRQRRETVEHPFGTLKMRMGATHFLMKHLPKVATEMALHVLAYNLTRVIGTDAVAVFAARTEGTPPVAAMTATRWRTKSAANSGNRSFWPNPQRYSIATLRPST
jgi:Transposase DDE domain